MRIFFAMFAAMAALLAVLLGFYVRNWIEDTWPLNMVFFGHRLTVLVSLGFLMVIAAFSALSLWGRWNRGRIGTANS